MKKHVVIICSEDSFDEKRNLYIKETGMSGKGYSFDFIKVSKSEYYFALKRLKEINKIDPLSHLYVIRDYKSGKDFTRRIKKTLNKRFKKFLDGILESKKIVIDLKKQSSSELFGNSFSDKKRQYHNQLKKTG